MSGNIKEIRERQDDRWGIKESKSCYKKAFIIKLAKEQKIKRKLLTQNGCQ